MLSNFTTLTDVTCSYGYESGRYGLGEDTFHKAQAVEKNVANQDHHLMSRLYFYYCRLCEEENRFQDAMDDIHQARWHIEQAAKSDQSVLKSELYIKILSNQGIVLLAMKRYTDSEKAHKEAIEVCKGLGMAVQCSMGNLMQNLGSCYLWSGSLEKAEATLQKALLQPNNNPEGAKYTMGNLLLRLKRYEEALALPKEVLQIYMKELGSEHPTTADSWCKVGSIFSMSEFSGRDTNEAI